MHREWNQPMVDKGGIMFRLDVEIVIDQEIDQASE